LSIINLASAEQCLEGVVSGDDETGEVNEELATDVEEDEEEVETDKAEEDVDLGDIGLLFEVVEHGILAQFLIDLSDLVLSFVLERHDDGGEGGILKGR